MSKPDIPILMYHALTEGQEAGVHRVHIPVAAFEEQMNWLAQQGYRALTMSEAVESLEKGQSLPERSVVITFDDGYLSLYRHARPILAKHSFAATLFVTTDPVGRPAYHELPGFEYEGQPKADRPLNWQELGELAEAGWAIEAHSCSHPHLSRLNQETLRHEIAGCKKIIEEHINRPVRYYAYPFGDYSRQTLAIIQAEGYKAACTVHVGKAPVGCDTLRLPRIEINTADNLTTFIRKVETGYVSDREKLRSQVRNLIYISPTVKDLIQTVARG
jgi:peptidoglycan/xylan/chitin deacetylase (PgdA/CDA1 family)